MKEKHPARNEYTVESGDFTWRGFAISPEKAAMRALSFAAEDLSLLTRVSSIKEGVWFYISTVSILKKLGLYKELKRIKRQISNGACPCCKRSFQNLVQHMKIKHPDYIER